MTAYVRDARCSRYWRNGANLSTKVNQAQRRTFRRSDVRRVWERQGRVCVLCARAIPFDLMHGDHVKPWSHGGATSLENCQALCGSCNLRKGSQPQQVTERSFKANQIAAGCGELRRWQKEALSEVFTKILKETSTG